jgi:hypothetical protein
MVPGLLLMSLPLAGAPDVDVVLPPLLRELVGDTARELRHTTPDVAFDVLESELLAALAAVVAARAMQNGDPRAVGRIRDLLASVPAHTRLRIEPRQLHAVIVRVLIATFENGLRRAGPESAARVTSGLPTGTLALVSGEPLSHGEYLRRLYDVPNLEDTAHEVLEPFRPDEEPLAMELVLCALHASTVVEATAGR